MDASNFPLYSQKSNAWRDFFHHHDNPEPDKESDTLLDKFIKDRIELSQLGVLPNNAPIINLSDLMQKAHEDVERKEMLRRAETRRSLIIIHEKGLVNDEEAATLKAMIDSNEEDSFVLAKFVIMEKILRG